MPDTGKFETWLAMNQEARARGQPAMPYPMIGHAWLASAILSFSTVVLVSFAFWYTLKFVAISWEQLPKLAKSPAAFIWSAGGVAVIGAAMCLLKRRQLLIYGSSELGVAIATSLMALHQLKVTGERWTFLLAIVGATYVFARGSDNLVNAFVKRK